MPSQIFFHRLQSITFPLPANESHPLQVQVILVYLYVRIQTKCLSKGEADFFFLQPFILGGPWFLNFRTEDTLSGVGVAIVHVCRVSSEKLYDIA